MYCHHHVMNKSVLAAKNSRNNIMSKDSPSNRMDFALRKTRRICLTFLMWLLVSENFVKNLMPPLGVTGLP